MSVMCQYCDIAANLVTGEAVYPHRPDLAKKSFYVCNCGARVGCHKNTTEPLGTLASAELRRLRNSAHNVFDVMWKQEDMTRSEAYAWLADRLGLDVDECHIGMFNEGTCRHVIEVCKNG